jgi:hypothetical protein
MIWNILSALFCAVESCGVGLLPDKYMGSLDLPIKHQPRLPMAFCHTPTFKFI